MELKELKEVKGEFVFTSDSWQERYVNPKTIAAGLICTIILVYCVSLYMVPPTDYAFGEDYRPIEAIVTLATSDYAQNYLLDGLLDSLQGRIGDTPIYAITDRPDCFTEVHYDNVHFITIPPTHGKMQSQSFKTRMFDLIPADIDDVLYIDCDVRATKQLKNYPLRSLPEDSTCDLILSKERPHIEIEWNAGIFSMNRQRSQTCLASWKDEILSGHHHRDQDGLLKSIQRGDCNVCLFSEDFVAYPKSFHNLFGMMPVRPLKHYTSTIHGTKQRIEDNCREFHEIYCFARYFRNDIYLEVDEKDFC